MTGASGGDGTGPVDRPPQGHALSRGRRAPSPAHLVWAEGISVGIVDSDAMLAEALAVELQCMPGVLAALHARDPKAMAWAVDTGRVGVVVVGTDSDEWDALELLRWTARRRPGIALVAMSDDDDAEAVLGALVAGAMSWVPKHLHLVELLPVLVAASRGESFVPPDVLSRVLRAMSHAMPVPRRTSSIDDLTDRERAVLEQLALGLQRAEIAQELGLSVNTVRTHVGNVLGKLGVHTSLEAVATLLGERVGARGAGPAEGQWGRNRG